MRHQQPTDELVELAALYALGALDPEQVVAFEAHLADGCRACEGEVKAMAAVVMRLGYAAPVETPRAQVRDRLLDRVRAGAQPGRVIVRATEGKWETVGAEGVRIRRLFRDPRAQRFTALGRMEPGARYPSHRHADMEELYMLEGDLSVEGQVLRAGDYCAASGGTVHGVTYTESGCTFLVHTSERDQVIDQTQMGAPQAGLVFVRAAEGGWEPGPDKGVTRRTIYRDLARGTTTRLVRMEAGARLQVAAEQLYMLEGDSRLAGQLLAAGDYYGTVAATEPQVTYTERGCLFLEVSSPVS